MNQIVKILALFLLLSACGNQRRSNDSRTVQLPSPEQDSIIQASLARMVDSCIFVDSENWLPFPFENELSKVIAVEYQSVYEEKTPGELALGKVLTTDRFSKIVALDLSQIQQVKEIFQGYENGYYAGSGCYEPRHCLYFLDEFGRILAYCEFCFACRQMVTSHRDFFSIVCYKQLTTFKYFFQGLGMTKFKF